MASTTSGITGIVSGANSSLVKLATGSIVNLADYQKLFAAAPSNNKPQIAGILKGAEESMVQLDDGRIVNLADYVYQSQEAEEGEEPVIAASLQGSYGDTVKTAGGITSLEELYRVPPAPPS